MIIAAVCSLLLVSGSNPLQRPPSVAEEKALTEVQNTIISNSWSRFASCLSPKVTMIHFHRASATDSEFKGDSGWRRMKASLYPPDPAEQYYVSSQELPVKSPNSQQSLKRLFAYLAGSYTGGQNINLVGPSDMKGLAAAGNANKWACVVRCTSSETFRLYVQPDSTRPHITRIVLWSH